MGIRRRMPRRFWLTVAGLVCWMGLLYGVYFASTGYLGLPTLLLLAVGLAAMAAVIDGRVLKLLEARVVPSFQVILALLLWGAVGLIQMYQLVVNKPSGPGGSPFLTIVGLGSILLLAAALWQVVAAMRPPP